MFWRDGRICGWCGSVTLFEYIASTGLRGKSSSRDSDCLFFRCGQEGLRSGDFWHHDTLWLGSRRTSRRRRGDLLQQRAITIMVVLSMAIIRVEVIRVLVLGQSRTRDASPVLLAASLFIISFTLPFPPIHLVICQLPRKELLDEKRCVAGERDFEVHKSVHHFSRDDLVDCDQGQIPLRRVAADGCDCCILEHA